MSRENFVRRIPGIHIIGENAPEALEFEDIDLTANINYLASPESKAPFRKHDTDSGFDLTAVSVKPHDKNPEVLVYGTGIRVQLPPGHELQIRPRSSIRDYDMILINSPGTVDEGYLGEIMVCFRKIYRPDGSCRVYEVGDKICQAVCAYVVPCKWTQVENLEETSRGSGGFGSTGK